MRSEIFGPTERRRVWGAQEKSALLAEVDAEGGKVRFVARRHRISESLLYNWRAARKAAAVATVGVTEGKAPGGPMLLAPPELDPLTELPPAQIKTGSIEIALPNGARISVDTSVNEKALSRVLRAMRELT